MEMKPKELGLTLSHEQEKGLKELKAATRESRIPADTPYQGFYAAITAEFLIFKSHFVLLACTEQPQILNQVTQVPTAQNIPDPEGSVPHPREHKTSSCAWCGCARRILMPGAL